MLVKMQFAGKISLLPDFADYTLMTNLFLLGALTCAYGSNRLLGKVVFAIGLWRLFALGLLSGLRCSCRALCLPMVRRC